MSSLLLSACRTPIGRYLGGLSGQTAVQLGIVAAREALKRAGIDAATVDEIPNAHAAVGMRNFIVHEYRKVDEETIWSTAVGEIPQLRAELAYILERAGYRVAGLDQG